MSDRLGIGQWIAMIATVLVLLAGVTVIQVYKFRECRDFGHSTFYCIFR